MKRGIGASMWLKRGVAVLSLLFSAATAIADGSLNSALTIGLRGGQESATASTRASDCLHGKEDPDHGAQQP